MRTLTLLLVVAALLSGCVVLRPMSAASAPRSGASCPPGHVWSDGKCHDRGKGHDPAKHKGKGKGKHK